MKYIVKLSIVVIGLIVFSSLAFGQDSSQTAVASKSAKFGTVAKTDAEYTKAIDAHDFAGAEKLFSEEGAFKGTVAKVFVPNSGTILILNFDNDYKKALTAVVKKANFKSFPDMNQLVGKEVVITGTFNKFNGTLQIELTGPQHVLVVK